MSERKAVIRTADMPYEMQQHAMDCATLAFIKYKDKKVCQYTESICLVGWLVVNFRMLIHCLSFSGYCKVYKRGI